MVVRKQRKPSQREPIGNTKSEIIVYIANNETSTITDIRRHLRDEKNIRNVKVVRKHLSDLENEGIINIKKAEKKGLSDIYYIEKSFSKFKDVFNYLNDFHKPLFLRSRYAVDMINNEKFLVYGFVNVVKELFTELLKLSDKNYFNAMIEKAKRNGEDLFSKETKEKIKTFKNQLKGYNLGDLQNFLLNSKPEDLVMLVSEYIPNLTDPLPIIKIFIDSIFPDKQRNEILKIISTSPMAMDYFLNLKSTDRLHLFTTFFNFYLQTLFKDSNKISLIEQFDENQSELKNNPMSFISQILSIQNVANDNPLLTILRSYFIVDSLNGNVVENEYSNTVLKEILLPKVIQ
jgi:hypothetical protein